MPFPASAVLLVALLLAVAYLFAQVARHAGIPAPVAVTLVGIAAGGMFSAARQIQLGPLLFGLFLPALIFEATWNMDAAALWRVRRVVAILALPGVLFTAAAIALCARASSSVDWGAALTLGAILTATDPIAVLALFRRMSLPAELIAIVEGESIGNDAVALVLVQTVVPVVLGGVSEAALGIAVLRFAYVACAGVTVGIVCAYAASCALSFVGRSIATIPLTVAVAYGSYAAASALGASGIFAVAAAGIALRAFTRAAVDASASASIERFWDLGALLANSVVFLLVGLTLRIERMFHEPALFALTVSGAVAARLVLAYVFARRPVGGRDEPGWNHAIALAGLRGGLCIAMALGLPVAFPARAAIIDAVFAVVFLTLVVQGWVIAPIVRRLVPSVTLDARTLAP